ILANHLAELVEVCPTYRATHDSGLPLLAYQQSPHVETRSQEICRIDPELIKGAAGDSSPHWFPPPAAILSQQEVRQARLWACAGLLLLEHREWQKVSG